MDPDTINCVILRIHLDKKIIIPSHAIWRQTSVSARYGSKKTSHSWTYLDASLLCQVEKSPDNDCSVLVLVRLQPDVAQPGDRQGRPSGAAAEG